MIRDIYPRESKLHMQDTRPRHGGFVGVLLILAGVAMALFALASTGCSSKRDARHAVEAMGFSGVTLTGWAWWQCGRDDELAQRWTGKRADGVPVKGVACCSWVRGCAVRITP